MTALLETDKFGSQDLKKPLKIHGKLAFDGFALSQFGAADIRHHGFGAPVGKRKTLYFYLQSCVSGHEIGCMEAGRMHFSSDGVARNLKSAVSFFRQACEMEHADGCYEAGAMFFGKDALKLDDGIVVFCEGLQTRAIPANDESHMRHETRLKTAICCLKGSDL